MTLKITEILRKELKNHLHDPKILLCIGSKKCIGDSLGPLVGKLLTKKLKSDSIHVIGTMEQCISYSKIEVTMKKIKKDWNHPYILVVDAALSQKEYVGNIIISKNKITLGKAMKKQQYSIGDFSIRGIVGEQKERMEENREVLLNTSEELVITLADSIANQIKEAVNK